jgi:hypothetical protein
MGHSGTFRIQAEAARALAEWKAFFADQVALQAKELARDSNPPGLITIHHYRQAAKLAMLTLETRLQDTDSSDGRQEAA